LIPKALVTEWEGSRCSDPAEGEEWASTTNVEVTAENRPAYNLC